MRKLLFFGKLLVGLCTNLTITVLYMGALPSIMEWKVVQDYPYLPHIFTLVVLFWVIYLVYWVVKDEISRILKERKSERLQNLAGV